jgi:hypothetical protein
MRIDKYLLNVIIVRFTFILKLGEITKYLLHLRILPVQIREQEFSRIPKSLDLLISNLVFISVYR